uniref:Avidin n=1 Tax=Melopsittacus undulatus TaxID=13146 RepID=A0A8C6JYX7_MELUD
TRHPASPLLMGSGYRSIKGREGAVLPSPACLLSGSWRSDTGCRMVVFTVGKDGSFSGSYLPGSAAGNSNILSSPLKGSQQDVGLVLQPIFSFTVHWQHRGKQEGMSVFLGQCYVGTNGEETLHALWLLREASDSPEEDWKATRIGTTIFTRIR